MSDDRRVHAVAGEWLLVRYNRAGKWYIEYEPPRGRGSIPVKIAEAVRLALLWEEIAGGTIYFGLPGGGTFDRLVRIRREQG